MGMNATVVVWVGIELEGEDWSGLRAKLPPALFAEPDDPDDEEIVYPEAAVRAATGGPNVDVFHCSEELVGFGVDVFSHDWDDGVIAFDADSVKAEIETATVEMREFFARCGIDAEVGVWCQTDWS